MSTDDIGPLAHEALNAAIDGKHAAQVTALLDQIQAAGGLGEAMVHWAFALLDHAGDGEPIQVDEGMAGYNYDTGAETSNLPKHIAWSAKFIQSISRSDDDTTNALIAEVRRADDGWEKGDYVLAMLNITSHTIRGTPRGYALMDL